MALPLILQESGKPQPLPKALVSVERPHQKPNVIPALNSVVLAQVCIHLTLFLQLFMSNYVTGIAGHKSYAAFCACFNFMCRRQTIIRTIHWNNQINRRQVRFSFPTASSLVGQRLTSACCSRSIYCRAAQTDSVEMYKCFRPGDIVRAEVVSSHTIPASLQAFTPNNFVFFNFLYLLSLIDFTG